MSRSAVFTAAGVNSELVYSNAHEIAATVIGLGVEVNYDLSLMTPLRPTDITALLGDGGVLKNTVSGWEGDFMVVWEPPPPQVTD
jgi:hypothetical protein